MKVKNIVCFVFLIIIVLFFSLYFTTMGGYYEYEKSKKTTLTQDAIERFEKDVEEGREIVASNYLEEEANYSNLASKTGMKISLFIEKGFDKAMNTLFKGVEKVVNEK